MRHRRTVPKLGRTSSHRKAMFRNMVTSLFREERVETTVTKAKEARRVAERLITFAKRGDLHARRQAARMVRDQKVLQKLFDDLGPRFAERPGGYTRILKTGFRNGDNAPMSILELLPDETGHRHGAPEPETEGKGKKPKGEAKGDAKKKKPEGKAKGKAGSEGGAKSKAKSKAKGKSKKKAAAGAS